jgi:hypothetical protein
MDRNSLNGTVYFSRRNKNDTPKQIVTYSKLDWAVETRQPTEIVEAALDKLRLEVRLRGRGIDGISRKRDPLKIITESASNTVLNEASALLDLERIIAARRIDLLDVALSAGFRTRDFGLFGFMYLVQKHGINFYKNPDFNWPKRTYYDRRERRSAIMPEPTTVASKNAVPRNQIRLV